MNSKLYPDVFHPAKETATATATATAVPISVAEMSWPPQMLHQKCGCPFHNTIYCTHAMIQTPSSPSIFSRAWNSFFSFAKRTVTAVWNAITTPETALPIATALMGAAIVILGHETFVLRSEAKRLGVGLQLLGREHNTLVAITKYMYDGMIRRPDIFNKLTHLLSPTTAKLFVPMQ